MKNVIFQAKKIITMNPSNPITTHVAVRDGRILATGDLESLKSWGPYEIENRLSEKILMPGLVEGHAHAMEGTYWQKTYCGYYDRMDPNGVIWPGLKTRRAVIERLIEAEKQMGQPDSPLSAWQLDPIYFGKERITRSDLDTVSKSRPVGILHASGHILNVNTKALELAGLFRHGVNHPGIPLGEDGLSTGELKGPEAMTAVGVHVGFDEALTNCDEIGLRDFGKLCIRTGVTTVTDLAAQLTDDSVEMMLRVTAENSFPVRVVALQYFMGVSPKELVKNVICLKKKSTDLLRLGGIKVVADGSIQGFSARMRWPGYYNGAPNGLWYITPEQLAEIYNLSLKSGLQVHTHTNGDQATQLALETLEAALESNNVLDHRFTLQHCQLADAAQFRKMSKLGMCVNLFANHTYYWGDQHYKVTVGPERAKRMNACRTAVDSAVPMAIHSDAPVTPLGPLFTAWCAINRRTASDRIQGEYECINLQEALYAITLGAAYTLHMDHEVGSIESGKRADFAVLEDDPYEVDLNHVKDIRVWGTVQGGRVFAASDL